MSDDIFESLFRGTSGLFDDGEVTFTEVRFIKDPSYADTESGDLIPVFATDLVTDEPDVGNNGTIENKFFTIGTGWEIEDGGAKVVRKDGKEGKGFNKSTYLQAFLGAMLDLDGGMDAVRARYEDTGATPQEAAFWEGLRVHVEQVEYETGGWGNVGKETRSRLMPTEILGWGEVKSEPKSVAKKAAPVKKAAAKKAAAPKPAVEETPYQAARTAAGSEVVDAIRAIADECEDTDSFMERCYSEVEGIDADADIQLLVDDVESADSIWAEAVAAAS